MENIAYLIKELRERGIGVSLSGNDLEISQLKGEIDQETIALIRDNKADLVTYLCSFSFKPDFLPQAAG